MQLMGGIILSVGFIPQIVQIFKTRSVKDLSLKSYLLMLFGISLMEVYAVSLVVEGAGLAFLMTNTLSFMMVSMVILLILRFRSR
nr:PQ-loop domain-containing transporter [Paenibacillus brevis]